MASIRQNRLIPLFALVVVAIVVAVVLKIRGTERAALTPVALKEIPKTQGRSADADTPADTLRTLTVEVNKTKEEIQKLRAENEQLRQDNATIRSDKSAIEDNVTRNLVNQLNRPETANAPVFSTLNARLDDLASRLERYAPGAAPPAPGSDIPSGLGFDTNHAGVAVTSNATSPTQSNPQLLWIEPLGTRSVTGANGQLQIVRAAFTPEPANTTTAATAVDPGGVYRTPATTPPTPIDPHSGEANAATGAVAPSATLPPAVAYFTIPENATLIGSTTMTALVGRIPVNGKVTDAMPFKVLIGRTNLAANGFDVPEDIAGMVVSGIAVGDWTLECTQGFVQSITFLYQDGTIRTISHRNQGALAGDAANAVAAGGITTTQKIGWLSDERGVPCIAGKRITNAPSYLSTTVGLKALETAARAAALSQTTTATNGLGGSTSAITGDQTQFIVGNLAAGGVGEITDWINQRLSNSFDAVYVQPGLPVAVHIEQELSLDKAPEARRLDYGHDNDRRTRRAQLD